MPRDVPIGNGRLLIGFDADYCIRDIYFPYAGQENHTDGHKFRFGVWSEGKFSWTNRTDWGLNMEYAHESLMTHITASNEELGVSLRCNDLVDHKEDIYIKKTVIRNISTSERELRIFFHHDFHILESPSGDTAYYDPDEKALIHYKGNRYFLISGIRNDEQGLDQYATGVKEFHGMEGTWKDAEDGRLEGGPISQGSVDSVLSFSIRAKPGEEHTLYYWITAGKNYAEASALNRLIAANGVEHFIKRTESYWSAWLNKERLDLSGLPPKIREVYKTSLLVISTNTDSRGAIIAANDSDVQHFSRDTYSYMWPRDGAFAAYALDLAGYMGSTQKFFDFCLDILSEGKEAGGYFLHKYHPDGCLGSSWHPWVQNESSLLPIQEDGTGLVLWALWKHFDKYRDIEFAAKHYEDLVIRCADFLVSYRDPATGLPLPSYDLWEENRGVHTFTVSAVYAGLMASANFSEFFGDKEQALVYSNAAEEIRKAVEKHLYSKSLGRFLRTLESKDNGTLVPDTTIDASLFAPFYFGLFGPDDERVVNTMNAIVQRLRINTPVGGIARYENDNYYRASDNNDLPGNPWFICTLWLAQWQIAKAANPGELKEKALPLLEWVCARALSSNVLPEQLDPFTGGPVSASPLTWSHAAFVAAVHEYMEKLRGTHICPTCGKLLPLQERSKRP